MVVYPAATDRPLRKNRNPVLWVTVGLQRDVQYPADRPEAYTEILGGNAWTTQALSAFHPTPSLRSDRGQQLAAPSGMYRYGSVHPEPGAGVTPGKCQQKLKSQASLGNGKFVLYPTSGCAHGKGCFLTLPCKAAGNFSFT